MDEPISPHRTATIVNPNDPPWNGFIAVAVWIASVLLVVLVPSILILPYIFSVAGPDFDQARMVEIATKDPFALFLQVIAILPAHLITLAISWFVVTKFRTFPFRESLGWSSGGMRWYHHALVLIGFFGVALVVGYFIPEQENELLRLIKSSKLALYTVAALAVLTAPLVEEVVYRGILYSAFQRTVGSAGAVVVVTILFALVHVPQYLPSVSTILLLTLLSLILTVVRARTGNLWPCIVLHAVFNAIQSGLLLVSQTVDAPETLPVDPALFLFGFK